MSGGSEQYDGDLWEYLTIRRASCYTNMVEEYLKEYGKQGWELVQFVPVDFPHGDVSGILLFKRKKIKK